MNTALFSCKNQLKIKGHGCRCAVSYTIITKLSLFFENTETVPWKVNAIMAQGKDRLSIDVAPGKLELSLRQTPREGAAWGETPATGQAVSAAWRTASETALNYYILLVRKRQAQDKSKPTETRRHAVLPGPAQPAPSLPLWPRRIAPRRQSPRSTHRLWGENINQKRDFCPGGLRGHSPRAGAVSAALDGVPGLVCAAGRWQRQKLLEPQVWRQPQGGQPLRAGRALSPLATGQGGAQPHWLGQGGEAGAGCSPGGSWQPLPATSRPRPPRVNSNTLTPDARYGLFNHPVWNARSCLTAHP